MNNITKVQDLIKKVAESKKGKLDLSSAEDLSIAIMNLVSLEEHFFFTGAKENKSEYYDLLNESRGMRTELMKMIIKEYEGEVWCVSKHLLAASMRLIEAGTKYYKLGKKKIAEDLFAKAYKLYALFWAINLKLVNSKDLKKIDGNQLNIHDKEKSGLLVKFGELLKKAIDCCIE